MEYRIPRIMIAGSSSGCGKTTVTCAVLKALSGRGITVGAFKCGPDYIDPMFHSRITGSPSTNLDPFFFSDDTLRWLLAKNGSGKDICIIEGVMGFYDGLGIDSVKASSHETALITRTPVILTVNAKGSALSLLAEIHGFASFIPENRICGVILNRCSAMAYKPLAEAIRDRFQGRVRPLGFLPMMQDCAIESRHLGLITAPEISDFDEKTEILARQAEETISLDEILRIAEQAETFSCQKPDLPRFPDSVRIAAARDPAFCFYYHDNTDLLQEMGAEIIPFSPIRDHSLPEGIHGLYLGGGYPELYARELSENTAMRSAVRNALEGGLPCIAECGGFMYLTEAIGPYPMTGICPGTSYNNNKLTRFGYIRLKAVKDNMLCKAGEEIAGHEFHYWDCEDPGSGFIAGKISGKQWSCVHTNDHLYAGFPHFHFYADPEFAQNFYKACLRYKEKKNA